MDETKRKIAEIEAKIAEIRANGDLTPIEQARAVLEAKNELTEAKAELATLVEAEEALAELDAPEPEAEVVQLEVAEPVAQITTEPVVEPAVDAPVALAASASTDTDASPEDAVPAKPTFTLTAGANMGNVTSGSTITTEAQVMEQLNTARRATEGRARLFTVNRFADDAKVVSMDNSAITNSRIIAEAQKSHQQPLALTAAACFCGPDEVKPDFDAIGSRRRPVAGIFPTIPISGGWRYLKDIAINPDSGSVNLWTCDDQDDVDPEDPDTWKQCSELDCFDELVEFPYMITACTIVNRMHQWAHPEQIRTWLDKIEIEYARLAERALLDIIHANAINPLTVGAPGGTLECYGIKSQVEYALAQLAFSMGYQFRAEALEGHTVIAPRGLVDAMVADEHIRGFDHNMRRAEIVAMFADYGVRLVERLDEATALATAAQATVTALNAGGQVDLLTEPLRQNPTTLYVLRPDQWVHAEGTLVATDWHVDTNLLRQNKMLYFYENLEQLVNTGLERAYRVDIYGLVSGTRADLTEPPCTLTS